MAEAYAIKPCPFCGCEATCLPYNAASEFRVECSDCTCTLTWTNVKEETYQENEQQAIATWNRRVPVTVSEKGEAETLLREATECIVSLASIREQTHLKVNSGKVLDRIYAYLSRGQG